MKSTKSASHKSIHFYWSSLDPRSQCRSAFPSLYFRSWDRNTITPFHFYSHPLTITYCWLASFALSPYPSLWYCLSAQSLSNANQHEIPSYLLGLGSHTFHETVLRSTFSVTSTLLLFFSRSRILLQEYFGPFGGIGYQVSSKLFSLSHALTSFFVSSNRENKSANDSQE